MIPDFSARRVTALVIDHLERRRYAIRGDVGRARAEVMRCLEPVRRAYLEEELPPSYLAELEREIADTVPERWCSGAERMTSCELEEFGVWRGGDVIARATYVFFFAMATAILAASQAPLLLKLVAALVTFASWWLPSAQVSWQRRSYRRSLDAMAEDVARLQPLLERTVSMRELLLPDHRPPSSEPDPRHPWPCP